MANLTLEYEESGSAGLAQLCSDAGGKWHSTGRKLILTFPDEAAVNLFFSLWRDQIMSEWPSPSTSKSAKSASPDREWRTHKDGSSAMIKGFTPTVSDLGAHQIRFIVSTNSVDRAGDVVNPAGLDVSKFLANPVVQYSHNYDRPPIGRALSVTKTENGVEAVIEFTPPEMNAFGSQVYKMIRAGFLRACSIGFMPIDFTRSNDPSRPGGIDFHRSELMEISICPVPANAEALARSVKGAGDDEISDAELREMVDRAIAEATDYYTPAEVDQLIAAALDLCERIGI